MAADAPDFGGPKTDPRTGPRCAGGCGGCAGTRPLGLSDEVHDALFALLDEIDTLASRLCAHGILGVRSLGDVIIAKHVLLDAMERAAAEAEDAAPEPAARPDAGV